MNQGTDHKNREGTLWLESTGDWWKMTVVNRDNSSYCKLLGNYDIVLLGLRMKEGKCYVGVRKESPPYKY